VYERSKLKQVEIEYVILYWMFVRSDQSVLTVVQFTTEIWLFELQRFPISLLRLASLLHVGFHTPPIDTLCKGRWRYRSLCKTGVESVNEKQMPKASVFLEVMS